MEELKKVFAKTKYICDDVTLVQYIFDDVTLLEELKKVFAKTKDAAVHM